MVQNLLLGNFTEIGKSLIDNKKEKINLEFERLNLKSREMAYLVEATKKFDNDKSRMIKSGINKG